MSRRFISIWFRHLTTDWLTLRRPELKNTPFVFAQSVRGRMMITAANIPAEACGIIPGMVVADARALLPALEVVDEMDGQAKKLLTALGEWCIRYTPLVAVDMPAGLMLDVSGCTHLRGGERGYLGAIIKRLRSKGYDARGAMADTTGTAWAIARYGRTEPIIAPGKQKGALSPLPPAALRLEPQTLERLQKLGFYTIGSFSDISRQELYKRFGPHLLQRLDQAFGNEDEPLQLLQPVEPYHERLPCLEPICTAAGISIAIKKLLENLCMRLQQEGKGLRTVILKYYRIDGESGAVSIGTGQASHHISHLFSLFEPKIASIAPGMGIELFTIDAPKVEDVTTRQEGLWQAEGCRLDDTTLAELLDKLANRVGAANIRRYLPAEHHWPERSIKLALSPHEKRTTTWRTDRPRPSLLLPRPERIEVSAPIPDYPPMLFIYKDKVHHIKKADGPERIEREWWLDNGEHRDYYYVEDQAGCRYWLFRSGHYSDRQAGQWFIHGFFA